MVTLKLWWLRFFSISPSQKLIATVVLSLICVKICMNTSSKHPENHCVFMLITVCIRSLNLVSRNTMTISSMVKLECHWILIFLPTTCSRCSYWNALSAFQNVRDFILISPKRPCLFHRFAQISSAMTPFCT